MNNEELKIDVIKEYNLMAKNLYKKYGYDNCAKIRLEIMQTINNHIIEKTIDLLDKDGTNKYLDQAVELLKTTKETTFELAEEIEI